MDVGPSPVQEEVLVPQLAWGLKNVSTMVESAEDVVVYSQPGTFKPSTSRLVKIHLADSSRWAALQTLKVCFEIKNESDSLPLELICPPLGVFDSYRLMSQGTVLTQIDFLARAITTLNATLDLPARELNGRESIGMKHGLHFKKKPNADGRYFLVDEDGVRDRNGSADQPPGMYKINADDPLPCISDLECERFMVIPPGQKRTVCVAPLCGVCNSGMFWPLPHCSLSFEFMLQASAADVCAGDTIAVPSPAPPILASPFGPRVDRIAPARDEAALTLFTRAVLPWILSVSSRATS